MPFLSWMERERAVDEHCSPTASRPQPCPERRTLVSGIHAGAGSHDEQVHYGIHGRRRSKTIPTRTGREPRSRPCMKRLINLSDPQETPSSSSLHQSHRSTICFHYIIHILGESTINFMHPFHSLFLTSCLA